MLRFFGSPDNVLAYAKTYTGITALGFPFLILTNGGGHLVRADGSPRNAMLYNLSGALINTVLDPLFILDFIWEWRVLRWQRSLDEFFRNPDYPVSAPLQKRTADSGASSTTENICKHDYLIGGGGIFQSAYDAGGADRVK
ncbi:MAG: MATE family efflux transporter [Clostridium fessum]